MKVCPNRLNLVPRNALMHQLWCYSPRACSISLIISQSDRLSIMHKHKLIELQKIIEERIGTLSEEVEIATNVKLNPLYIADRRDEIEFVRWTAAIINSILNQDIERKHLLLGTAKMRLDLADCIEFENTLQSRVEELNLILKDSNNLRNLTF